MELWTSIVGILHSAFAWISANSAGIGILATILSLAGAAYSWVSAKRSLRAADRSTLQAEVREVALAAKAIAVQIDELEKLGLDLYQAYVSLGVFTGSTGSSRLETLKRDLDEKVSHARKNSGVAFEIVAAPLTIKQLRFEELLERKLTLEMVGVELSGLQRTLNAEYERINDQVKMYQQKQVR